MSFAAWSSQALAQQEVVNGMTNGECVFPTAVFIGGCTATLVHERAITTAQHCKPGAGTTVTFGEESAPTRNPVTVTKCITGSSMDGAICELSAAVEDIPITPIAFGCEIDKYMKKDEPVWISGYGNIANMTPTDRKRWAEVYISEVLSGHTVIGAVVNGSGTIPSPCRGDSGGPVFLRTDDGSYRVFGTVFQGTTGTPCNGVANFQRVDTIVSAFESATGLDITPCFNGETGDWDPGEDCGGFYADEPGLSDGTWDKMCANAKVSPASTQCGDANPILGTGGAPGAGGGSAAGGSATGAAAGGTGSMGGATGSGASQGSGGLASSGGTGTGAFPGSDADGEGTADDPGCACSQIGGRGSRSRLGGLALLFVLFGGFAARRMRARNV